MTPPGPADAAPEDNMQRMLLLICLASLALDARPTLADFPRLIHYQGIITDSAGVPITDPAVSVRYPIAMNKDLKAVRSESESLRSRLDQLESTP